MTGSVLAFERAARQIAGLEFLGAEELDEDELDKRPALYLMVPSEGALRNIVTLWRGWQANETVPAGYSQWKALLSQLRDVRPWGPQDRITPADRAVLAADLQFAIAPIRVEIELVYRQDGAATEASAAQAVILRGGTIVSRSRIAGAGYHALLCDVPPAVLGDAIALNPTSIAAEEAVLQIRPQSLLQIAPADETASGATFPAPLLQGQPIAAIFDAVPLAGHPRLAGRLSIEDPFGLEPLAVGARRHGTAMASAVLHGDLYQPWQRPLERPVHFVNMMFAGADPNHIEQFPDRLPADLFEEALVRMREGADPSAPHVVVINASLGDLNKPFSGRMSGWARVVDYLSNKYGVLFVVSAGNHGALLETQNMTASQFEGLGPADRAKVALRASASQIATRRVLAPAEAMNAVTVGALHADQFATPALPATTFDVWQDTGMCTVSSALGPGHNGAIKPDILAPGGRHHVRLAPYGDHHHLHPLSINASAFGGICVAVPPSPTSLGPDVVGRTVGTSVAAALATGAAARAHEALEAAYPDFVQIPGGQRAALLKALLVHGARWSDAKDLIIEILGPAGGQQHYRQKDNIRRYLGYGAYDPERLINCADDRATLWATASLNANEGRRFRIPWPASMSGKAQPHALHATLAWFTPPRPGAVAYRAVRMKIVEPDQLGAAGIRASGIPQPDPKQAHKGTVVHRRWEGSNAAAIAGDGYFLIDVQREADDLDQPCNFALVVTLEMAGEAMVYTEVRNRVAVQPAVPVPG